jgi:hypothetical protein
VETVIEIGSAVGNESTAATYLAHLVDEETQMELSVVVFRREVRIKRSGFTTVSRGPSEEVFLSDLGLNQVAVVRAADAASAVEWLLYLGADDVSRNVEAFSEWLEPPSGARMYSPSQVPGLTDLGSGIGAFAERVALDPLIPIARSPVQGKPLSALLASGSGIFAAAATGEPMLLVYALGAWIIVRVGDPVLGALGEGLADKVRESFERHRKATRESALKSGELPYRIEEKQIRLD